jgi:hypothetical protein
MCCALQTGIEHTAFPLVNEGAATEPGRIAGCDADPASKSNLRPIPHRLAGMTLG